MGFVGYAWKIAGYGLENCGIYQGHIQALNFMDTTKTMGDFSDDRGQQIHRSIPLFSLSCPCLE